MMEDAKLIIGHKVRAVRELMGMSQEYVAQKLDISQSKLSKIENDEIKLTFEEVYEISKILGVDINNIINFDKSFVFNSCTQSGYIHNQVINSIEAIEKLYERIISEKDDRIKFLEKSLDDLKTK